MEKISNTRKKSVQRFDRAHLLETFFIFLGLCIFPFTIYALFSTHEAVNGVTTVQFEVYEPNKIVTHDTSTQPIDNSQIQKIVDDFAKQLPVKSGILVRNLTTDHEAYHNIHQSFRSASLYKLFTALETLRKIDDGEIKLNDSIKTTFDDETVFRSVEYCLERSINASDNPCGIALGNLVGWDDVNSSLRTQGFSETDLNHSLPTTSTRDIAHFFTALYDKSIGLSDESRLLLLSHLKDQRVANRIPRGLPAAIDIAHKTGDIDGFAHDAGIVYSHGNYVIVILSGPWSEQFTNTVYSQFGDFSKSIYSYFDSL